MRHNFLAQFLLIAALALGSSSAFAEEGFGSELSSQIIVEAEESISEELKSIYQEEVAQVLAEGISYSEEERLSDFPDLDSLLADEVVPTRVAKISADKKVEKGKSSNSELKFQNPRSTSKIFSMSSIFSQNCLLGLNVLLTNLKIEQEIGPEFLPKAPIQRRTRGNEAFPVRGSFYAEAMSGCANTFSLYLGGEGFAIELACSAENQQNSLLEPGVPTMSGWNLGKITENALEANLGPEFDQIMSIVLASGKSYKKRTFPHVNQSQRARIGKSILVPIGLQVAGEFPAVQLGSQVLNQELKSLLEKVASKAGQDSHKFSSGRPTPEILT